MAVIFVTRLELGRNHPIAVLQGTRLRWLLCSRQENPTDAELDDAVSGRVVPGLVSLEEFYGARSGVGYLRIVAPRGRSSGSYRAADCQIKLHTHRKELRGPWPSRRKIWRSVYLAALSEVLDSTVRGAIEAAKLPRSQFRRVRKVKHSKHRRNGGTT